MMICECNAPEPFLPHPATSQDKACKVCGHWWMPEHGSKPALRQPPQLPALLQRREFKPRPEPRGIRRAEAPGRNDLCPCDSGKKFKKCCGQ